jgi:hypothetical protein
VVDAEGLVIRRDVAATGLSILQQIQDERGQRMRGEGISGGVKS